MALMKASLFTLYDTVGERVSTAADTAMQAIGRMRVGVARRFFWEDLDAEVEHACVNAVRLLQDMVASVQDCNVPVNNDRTVQSSESYAYHKRWAEETLQRNTKRRRCAESRLVQGIPRATTSWRRRSCRHCVRARSPSLTMLTCW